MVRMLSLPPQTFKIRELYQRVVLSLPDALQHEQPTEALITLLRSGNLKNSLFLETCETQWPQRESAYPLDLISLWEEHSFISALASEVNSLKKEEPPTFKYDWIYRTVLARHSDLLSVLRFLLVINDVITTYLLELFGLTYQVLQPFLQFREFLDFPFPKGDSPLNFLSDPRRAAGLYRDNHDIAEEAMMLYISRAKEVLLGTSDIILDGYMLRRLLEQCPTSSKLLHELQSLDLRQLCDHHAENKDSHYVVHIQLLRPRYLNPIVDWLQELPDPPLHAIAFWENQIADILQCIEINDFKFPGDI
ncbi:hypothetical protein B0H11DRAFT_1993769 [Mycena galericulata]|nr:hypothetical protein B0H11DRAFT_1993769 [Mycena galericulata]